MERIYLDHNAATPIRPEVVEAIARAWRDGGANPASQHRFGQEASRQLEDAREAIAALLGADLSPPRGDRLVFTSGGTEANNLAVLGIAGAALGGKAADGEPGQIVVSGIEHSSILEPAERLLDEGWRVDTLGAAPDGVVRAADLPGLVSDRTRLVSVMLGNHETGVLQPVEQIAAVCRQAGVPLHTDAVQCVGKSPLGFRGLGVSAMTVTAHKFQGPPGIGALLLADGVRVRPLLLGGHQQNDLRPGTQSVALAVGMRTALELAVSELESHARRLKTLRDRFEALVTAALPDTIVHGRANPRLPQTSCVAFPGVDAQVLLMALDIAGVACSVGSACASGSAELSPTLLAMQLPQAIVAASLRFSVGATTTAEAIDEAAHRVIDVVTQLRR